MTKKMTHGGRRPGSGRPAGTNRWGEQTKPVRVPVSKIDAVRNFLDNNGLFRIPMYASRIPAGTPADVTEHIETYVDMTSALIKNPANTFFLRVTGDSMTGAGIDDGDILIVDKKIDPANGHIVVAYVDGDATVKRLKKTSEGVFLMPENENYKPIKINTYNHFYIPGVVRSVIKKTL